MLEEQRQELEELRKIVQEFQELVKHPGWVRLVEYGEGQITGREHTKESVRGMDILINNSIIDAEISGIRLFFKLPEMAIEDFQSQLDELKEEYIDG